MNKIEEVSKKTDKSRTNDNYALLYCKGKSGINKLVKICNENKSDFWIVNLCSRKDNSKINKMWDELHEYSTISKTMMKK